MSIATLVTIDSARLRELMVERDLNVAALAAASDVSLKTIYLILHGTPTTLSTAGRIYRTLGGDRAGFLSAGS